MELRVGESGGESAEVAETGVGRERDIETEALREWEREWREGGLERAGEIGLPNVKELIWQRRGKVR